jgi:uncharacterized surface protein with fasciclin (FAS1) repeats
VPADVLADLLADAESGGTLLAEILGLHVIQGAAVMSADLEDGAVVETITGELVVGVDGGAVTFSNELVTATVVAADIEATNGVIHVIDTVIVASDEAPEENTIVEIAVATEGFSTLVTAVTAAGLVDTLSGEGPFTVLAPNDDAFALIPADVIMDLLNDAEMGGTLLADILGMHVIQGSAVRSTDLSDGLVVETLNGNLTVGVSDSAVTFSTDSVTSTVIAADIEASNGIIHVIDTVITE